MNVEQQIYIDGLYDSQDTEMIQLVGFKLGDEEYAIDVLKIQEIIRLIEITSVPRMDSFVLGVMNLRGKVIPVIDLRVRFNLTKSDFDKKTRIIVVKFEKENIGFVVDEVTEVARIDKSMVEPTPPLVGAIGQEYILGICKYDERLIIILDIDRVVYEGDNYSESDLRKKFLGTDDSITHDIVNEKLDITLNETNENKEQAVEVAEKPNEIKSEEQKENNERMEVADAIQEMVADTIEENEPAENDLTDDIDALIAAELAKREKETEELIKKKKSAAEMKDDEDAVAEILNDAVSQAENVISHDAEHIDQDDLDALIAAELAIREQETEEMLKRKKEEEKKKSELDDFDDQNESIEELKEENKSYNKDDTNDDIIVKRDSIQELKDLAKKIIDGEKVDLSSDIKSEMAELLKMIVETKNKVDDLDPTINDSKNNIPAVKEALEEVNEQTEQAAFNLMEAADKMSSFYVDIHDSFENLEHLLQSGDIETAKEKLSEIEENINKADELGFRILQELEFQDITEQRLRKTINYVGEIGARLGTILGYVKLQQIAESVEEVSSQEDIDKLLSDFGL